MSLNHNALGASPLWRWLSARMWGLEHAFERARASGRATDDTRLRILFVSAFVACAFLALAVGATRAALFSGAAGSAGAAAGPSAARADLVDRNGALLAADLLHYGLYIDPREIWDTAETRAALTKALPELEPARLERALSAERRTYLLGALTPDERGRIHDLGLPGVSFEAEERRVYPLNATAGHLIGFANPAGEGLAGAERALDTTIRAGGADHASVPLSIDLRVQAALEDELNKAAVEFQAKGAVGVVLNVHSGELLGLASYPAFDPNRAADASDEAKLNRAAASVYEMGSTFKAFTVAVGLDSGVATQASTFDARAPFKLGYRTIEDYHAARKVLTLVEVFQHSSNIGTAKLAVAIGPERLSRYFTALGLTSAAKIELAESARPLTPKVWDQDAMASTSFGHGMNISPLTLSRAMAALLNGGTTPTLTIRKQPAGAKAAGPRAVSEETSRQMLQIMRANVTGGSGGKADVPGLSVGGKTGTGEKYDPAVRGYNPDRQVSSFAAVFPTDGEVSDPRYFVLILLDEPRGNAATSGFSTGGWVAAPAAGRVIARIAPFLGVRRTTDILMLAASGEPAAGGAR
jgi:cell division protein FtsI (penicillin-binding protein 3)